MCSGSYSHALLIKHLLSIWAYILLNICKYNLMSTFIHLFIKCGEYFFLLRMKMIILHLPHMCFVCLYHLHKIILYLHLGHRLKKNEKQSFDIESSRRLKETGWLTCQKFLCYLWRRRKRQVSQKSLFINRWAYNFQARYPIFKANKNPCPFLKSAELSLKNEEKWAR